MTVMLRALFIILLATGSAQAQVAMAPHVSRLSCAEGIELDSRGAPLSQVLLQMAATLEFELKYWGRDDPPVTWSARERPVALMTVLSHKANLLVRYEPDPRCPGESRIASVYVLPTGSTPASRVAPSPATAATARPVLPDPTMQDGRALPEYLRSRGLEPPPSTP